MRSLAAKHARDMAVMKMEIEHARSAAELEQIKATLVSLRRQVGGGQEGPRPPPSPPPPAQTSPAQGSPGPSPPRMIDVPQLEQQQQPFSADALTDEDTPSDNTEDDTYADVPDITAPVTYIRADVMNVRRIRLARDLFFLDFRLRGAPLHALLPLNAACPARSVCGAVMMTSTSEVMKTRNGPGDVCAHMRAHTCMHV